MRAVNDMEAKLWWSAAAGARRLAPTDNMGGSYLLSEAPAEWLCIQSCPQDNALHSVTSTLAVMLESRRSDGIAEKGILSYLSARSIPSAPSGLGPLCVGNHGCICTNYANVSRLSFDWSPCHKNLPQALKSCRQLYIIIRLLRSRHHIKEGLTMIPLLVSLKKVVAIPCWGFRSRLNLLSRCNAIK
ncbi:hypothetical protein LZ32DRAFT_235007 [Colletotrichum eremochloae]|nr:hypothetical protein LZ32DRAFT_235007 [Colletotrichum eremochloae]